MMARWISIILHPFVMVGVMVGAAAAAREKPGAALRSVAVVALFTIVPLAALMWRQMRRGRWQNVDASNKAERPVLYLALGIALVALLAFLVLLRTQSFMVRGVLVTFGMMAMCAVTTRWIKVSHTWPSPLWPPRVWRSCDRPPVTRCCWRCPS